MSMCQVHGGFEQYYYTGGGASSIVPRLYYESLNNWFGEIRYNYEELQTVSVNAGKKFSFNKQVNFSITPFAGLVLGRLTGGNAGSNISAEYQNLFFSSESQYTFSLKERSESFFFNWSEMGYQVTKFMYAGMALQFTHPFEIKNNWEPGFMVGIVYKNWTFPLYAFNPVQKNRNYVLGINWEWKYKNDETLNR